MKGIVAYDSVNGNTKQVAETIAAQIRAEGFEAELVFVKDKGRGKATGDFMFIGSPTRGGRMTGGTKEFVENLDVAHWKGRTMVAFDTVGPLSKDEEKRRLWLARVDEGTKNAATKIRELGQRRGLTFHPRLLHFAVTGMWGPLAPDALDQAKEATRQILAEMR